MNTQLSKFVVKDGGRMASSSIFRTRYRVVPDRYAGFEVQYRRWFSPFWIQHGFVNTHASIYDAMSYIDKIKNKVLYKE